MAKPARPAALDTDTIPGDFQTAESVLASSAATLDVIKGEIKPASVPFDEIREIEEAQRAGFASSISLIAEELAEAELHNLPKNANPGIDQASIDLIRAEMTGKNRRIVIQGG